MRAMTCSALVFLSTPSARRATVQYSGTRRPSLKFLSTPSARRATCLRRGICLPRPISIHALCEEGDSNMPVSLPPVQHFYPRPLRGGRPTDTAFIEVDYLFLSTPSARRATSQSWKRCSSTTRFLSTPSARRATRPVQGCARQAGISIHALCEEGDRFRSWALASRSNFYPRPLRGGRRWATSCWAAARPISIHALCEEGDLAGRHQRSTFANFYPRPLRGGRPWTLATQPPRSSNFYPRPLRGGRPERRRRDHRHQPISIHALCEEGDLQLHCE